MKALLSAILGLSITCAVLAASAAAEADTSQIPPKGYVVLKGEQARLARSGNLFRIVVRELVRKDGTKTTIYRDVDYPIRATAKEADAPVKAVLIEGPIRSADRDRGGDRSGRENAHRPACIRTVRAGLSGTRI